MLTHATPVGTLRQLEATLASTQMSQKFSDELGRLAMLNSILIRDKRPQLSSVVLGVEGMDDAALLSISDSQCLVVATDFVRGSGFTLFKLGYMDYFDVGYYLIMANASDLAAMGAQPIAATTVVRYTDKMTDNEFCSIFEGMRAAASRVGLEVIGGDIGGHSADVFSATAFGIVEKGRAFLRSNVKDKDLLCVTGWIGRPITALLYAEKVKPLGYILDSECEDRLFRSWRRPHARVTEALALAKLGAVHACQDISDGLRATIDQLTVASGKTFTIFAQSLPIDPATRLLAQHLNADPISLALSVSVDFELLFTIPSDREHEVASALKILGCPFHVIGTVNSLERNVLVDEFGNERQLPGMAWKQQTGDYLADLISCSNLKC